MCIICISGKGQAQPGEDLIERMFENNPDSAGYMYARNGRVIIHKGFLDISDLLRAIRSEKFTEDDVVVYHFRITTQAARVEMSQPFPITDVKKYLEALDVSCGAGIAHNGIIPITSTGDKKMSDTALYIKQYIKPLYHAGERFGRKVLDRIEKEAGGRMVFLHGDGSFETTGEWIMKHGLLFSNHSFDRVRFAFNRAV